MARFWVVQVQVTQEVEETLRLMAAGENRSLSNMTARLIDEALEARRQPKRGKAPETP